MSTDKNVYVDVWLISHLVNRLISQTLEDSLLSVDEFAMYGLISDLAPITSADLVRATGLSPTTISSMVRRCEARGELERQENPVDARSSLLVLTDKGHEVLGQVVPRLTDAIDGIKDALGGQHDAVREALRVLDQGLRVSLHLGPRPYDLANGDERGGTLPYAGEPLSQDQVTEVRQFIEWLRHRDNA